MYVRNTTEARPAAGDKLWLARRGRDHIFYIKRSGQSFWTRILIATNAGTFLRPGQIAIEFAENVSRWDNLTIGSVPGLFGRDLPFAQVAADNFNRANGLLAASAAWTGTKMRDATATNLGIVSNQLAAYQTGGNYIFEALGAATYGPDLDMLFDVTAMPVNAYDTIVAIWGITQEQTSTWSGNMIYFSNDGSVLPGYINGGNIASFGSSKSQTNQTVALNDTIWIRVRSRHVTVFRRAINTTAWIRLVDWDDTYGRAPRTGRIGFVINADSGVQAQKIDNLFVGNVPAPFQSVVMI